VRRRWLDAGREAGRICIGVIVMLAAAAIIESYVRQSHWSTTERLAFAAATGLFWLGYIRLGYRCERVQLTAGSSAAAV
jgi:apolipoprotein N-acyltransferase